MRLCKGDIGFENIIKLLKTTANNKTILVGYRIRPTMINNSWHGSLSVGRTFATINKIIKKKKFLENIIADETTPRILIKVKNNKANEVKIVYLT